MHNKAIDSRIEIMDSLRVVAVIMVMLYHYYSRFYGNHYTYVVNTSEFLKFEYLGVELFFIISGVVIMLTLQNCDSIFVFLKKRFGRLIPGMLICPTSTFSPNSHLFSNIIISNTFSFIKRKII